MRCDFGAQGFIIGKALVMTMAAHSRSVKTHYPTALAHRAPAHTVRTWSLWAENGAEAEAESLYPVIEQS